MYSLMVGIIYKSKNIRKAREGDKNKNYIWKISDFEKLQLDGGVSSDGGICSFAITKTEEKK